MQAIIKQVHTLPKNEEIPEGLKLENKTGQMLSDSAWIARVDYDEDAFDVDLDGDHKDNEQNDDVDDLPEHQFEDIEPRGMTEVEDENEDKDDNNMNKDIRGRRI